MIRILQKKFVISAMLAITILLIVLLGAINIGNIFITQRQNEQMLQMLLNEESVSQPPKIKDKDRPKGFLEAPMDENSKMSSVYFTVTVGKSSEIVDVNTKHIASISEEEAAEICKTVIGEGSAEGRIQSFSYNSVQTEHDGNRIYLFLNTSLQVRNILLVLFFSVTAGILCWLIMLLLVIFISKKAIRPIAENIERQKQFVTDAGHEIKTPLSIILANTEAMELYQGESKYTENIREQTLRLNGLMQNLLSLAKADESRNAVVTENFSLTDCVSETLQMFSEPMELKEINLYKKIEEGIEIKANKEQIKQLISILADNAVKYSVKNGIVSVTLEKKGKGSVFRIENTCAALPECPPEKLFDRFFRADTARTQQNGGYGIGLSAAKTITELYGGTIKASYRKPDRIIFTVKF